MQGESQGAIGQVPASIGRLGSSAEQLLREDWSSPRAMAASRGHRAAPSQVRRPTYVGPRRDRRVGHAAVVVTDFDDRLVRLEAFHWLDDLMDAGGDAFAWSDLAHGFQFQGVNVPLIGARGIWKPAVLEVPISITTSHRDPYGDVLGDDGFLQYRYFGTDASHPDNAGLRRAMNEGRALIYFRGIERGLYVASWPAAIVADDPAALTFSVAFAEPQLLRPDLDDAAIGEVQRRYTTHLAVQRLHQVAFRRRVLKAYRTSCTVCRLQYGELLDAAHIVGDAKLGGDPVVPNGLAMCKIHHAAFDRNILGISPDYRIEIRDDVLHKIDGPMLRYGLQEHHGTTLVLPRSKPDRPDPERLELRYAEFRDAS